MCHRQQLIEIHYPIVRRIAAKEYRRFPDQVDLDDVVSFGTLGLIKAVDVYDPFRCNSCGHRHYFGRTCTRCSRFHSVNGSRCECDQFKATRFEVVARAHIHGHILDGIRSADWAPRSVRKRQREMEEATKALAVTLKRDPTIAEVAAALKVPVEDIHMGRRDVESAKVASLDEPVGDDGAGLDVPDVTDGFQTGELMQVAERALRQLPPRIRVTVVLYYFEGWDPPAIAEAMRSTPQQVAAYRSEGVTSFREAMVGQLMART
jgi:RNA polymerase sigma factor for flagellar operon FliA